jgi:short subunit dehydrogenase-like uncharacterized protein
MSTPSYDLVAFGATSFVGKILCRYLWEEFGAQGGMRWGLAGRSKAKLEELRSSLGAKAGTLPLIVADAADESSLGKLCASTRVVAFMLAAALRPARAALERLLPKPGEGPSPEAQRKGFFDLRFFGTTADGRQIRTKVTGDRDPGYGSTGKMLGQAAACLALDVDKVATPGGFWTPATIFGDRLIQRLTAHSGLTFELVPGSQN